LSDISDPGAKNRKIPKMSSNKASPDLPSDSDSKQKTLARRAKARAASNAISQRIAAETKKSAFTQDSSEPSNAEEQVIGPRRRFKLDPRFTDYTKVGPNNNTQNQLNPRSASFLPDRRPKTTENELDYVDNLFKGLTPSSQPSREYSSALTAANWRVKSQQKKPSTPAAPQSLPAWRAKTQNFTE